MHHFHLHHSPCRCLRPIGSQDCERRHRRRARALLALCERIERRAPPASIRSFTASVLFAPVDDRAGRAGRRGRDRRRGRLDDLTPLAQALSRSRLPGTRWQSDLRILADRFGLLPKRAFDTQLAAAFCGYGMSISLGDLIHSLLDVRLRKAHTVSDWSRAPDLRTADDLSRGRCRVSAANCAIVWRRS